MWLAALIVASSGTVLTGCGSANDAGTASTTTDTTSSSTTTAASGPKLNLNVPAGITVTPPAGASTKQLVALAQEKGFHPSGDPFALTPQERVYNTDQTSERLVSQDGNMTFMGPQTIPSKPAPMIEAQPYRRLSGVSIGNAVYAILQTGTDNSEAQIIYPGAQVKGTDWTVVSINGDYAILKRSGNTLPHEIKVRLEEPPFGSQTGSGAGNQPGGTGPGTGKKGGRPSMGGVSGGGGGNAGAAS